MIFCSNFLIFCLNLKLASCIPSVFHSRYFFPLQREHGLLCLERVDPDWAGWSKIIQDWDAEVSFISFTVFRFPATIAFMIYSTPKRQSQSMQIISKPSTISSYKQMSIEPRSKCQLYEIQAGHLLHPPPNSPGELSQASWDDIWCFFSSVIRFPL